MIEILKLWSIYLTYIYIHLNIVIDNTVYNYYK